MKPTRTQITSKQQVNPTKFGSLKEKARKEGNAENLFQVGWAYEEGQYLDEPITKNLRKAVKWYRLAANRGNSKSHFNLGNIYYQVGVIQPDWKLALSHYETAADLGDPVAAYLAGFMYQQSQGVVTPDLTLAAYYYTLAKTLLLETKFLIESSHKQALLEAIELELKSVTFEKNKVTIVPTMAMQTSIWQDQIQQQQQRLKELESQLKHHQILQKENEAKWLELSRYQENLQMVIKKYEEQDQLKYEYQEKKRLYKANLEMNQKQLRLLEEKINQFDRESSKINKEIEKLKSIITNYPQHLPLMRSVHTP